ncbi:PTS sugar transporter subunit IIC, partial [Escherichia coli]
MQNIESAKPCFFRCFIRRVLDEFQTHRPLIACTVIGLILGDLK